MNPLARMQGEIASLSVPERARQAMLREEAAEDRQAEAARYERIARAEAIQMQMAQRQRIERYQQGYTSEEMAAWEAEREELRRGRIAELEAELKRLAPDHPYFVRRSAGWFATGAKLAEMKAAAEQNRQIVARAQLQLRAEEELRRSTGPAADCAECRDAGATQRESVAMHADGSLGAPVTRGGGYITRSSAPLSTLTAS